MCRDKCVSIGENEGTIGYVRLMCFHYTALKIHISLFPKEITLHSGIVWRDKKYCGRRQICEDRNIYYQISTFYMTEKRNVSFSHQTFNLSVCFHISCPKDWMGAKKSLQIKGTLPALHFLLDFNFLKFESLRVSLENMV